jgi:DNA-binding beta-propeller fold protein YncE
VVNVGSNNVTELSPSGALIGTYAVGIYPYGIAIDSSGNVWVVNAGNGTAGIATGDSNVTELSSSGALIGTYAVGIYPYGIAIELSGNNGEYFPYKGPEWPYSF